MLIQVNFKTKWELIDNPIYKWSECKQLINSKTGKIIKKQVKGLQVGYYIDRKFIKISDLIELKKVRKIEKIPCPF